MSAQGMHSLVRINADRSHAATVPSQKNCHANMSVAMLLQEPLHLTHVTWLCAQLRMRRAAAHTINKM